MLLERANELGRVVVRRAYGDFSNQSVSTRQAELTLLGFEFVHVYHPVKGKNSADIQIVVDVMEYIARIPDLEWVVLATGDSDFSPLFRRLRELGKSVVGVGPRSALSEAVKKSCNRFIYIDEERENDNATNATLREDSLDLLEQILDKFPDGISLSVLKNEMLEIDAAFNEKDLGFSGFMKFLQNAPEIVDLYQTKQAWHAKAVSAVVQINELPPDVTLLEPTTDLYKRFLRKSGWKSCESSFLWDALIKLEKQFPTGFTRSEEFDYLLESFGRSRTRGELRAVMYILYKTGFVVQQQHKSNNDEPTLLAKPPNSERVMSKDVDAVMLQRLLSICKAQNILFMPEFSYPLLDNTYTKAQFEQIMKKPHS